MKFRHFYKINHKKQPIPGSNVKRKSKPGNQWVEILDPCCSLTNEVDCTCGPRFFVQLDRLGKPVPGSLIRRTSWPRMDEAIKYQEIDWEDPCCNYIDITVTFPNFTQNGLRVIFTGLQGQGTYDTGIKGLTAEVVTLRLPSKGKYDISFENTVNIAFGSLCLNESLATVGNFGADLCRTGAAGISTRSSVNLDASYNIIETP